MRTRWTRLHPLTQWLYYVAALLLAMLLFHPVLLLGSIFTLTLVHWCAFRQFRLGNWFKMALVITLLFTIINPILSHRGSHIISVFSYSISLEALLYGVTWGLSLSLILLVFRLYRDCFPASLFLALFHRYSPQWSLLLMLSIRFVPMFGRRLREINISQAFRHADTPSWKEKLQRGQNYLLTLVSWCFEDALQTVDSMKARAYGSGNRSSYHCFRFTSQDVFLCVGILVLLVAEIFLWYLGYGRLQIYPQLGPLIPTSLEWVSIAIECFILGAPIWFEGGEQLRWYIWRLQTRRLLIQKQSAHR